jgi:predicted dinucleotide-binding enzyme
VDLDLANGTAKTKDMEIGVIGLNEYTRNLCRYWIKRGHSLVFADLHFTAGSYAFVESLGPQASLGLPEKVVLKSEVVVMSVPVKHLESTLDALDVRHKIVIDLVIDEHLSPTDSGNTITSFKLISERLPDAKVVKVTPKYPYYLFHIDSSDADTLYSYSNDDLAQRMVRLFIDGSGYKVIDLQVRGPIKK